MTSTPEHLPPLPAAPEGRDPRPRNRVRRALVRLIALLHRWGESGWAGPSVGLWNFLQGSVVPGPSEALLGPLGLADPRRAGYLALWATAGATLGGIVAYWIGVLAFDQLGAPVLARFGVHGAEIERYRAIFDARGWMFVAGSTISPLSTKIVSMLAGAFGVPFWEFTAALFAGRAARFFLVALVLFFAGARLLAWIERRLGRPIERVR